jgi:GNAT superfamily N-acetyltransferase
MSIYTEESYRRRGVAKMIVKTAIDWCKEHNYDRISLHAAEMGKQLYETFGFNRLMK